MNRLTNCRIGARRQRGQSMTEYMVVATALIVMLFAAGSPVGRELAEAVRNFYSSLTFFLSLP
jgi:hypothetical protein